MRKVIIGTLILTMSIFGAALPARAQATEPLPGVDTNLATLHVLRDYDTHKNSFVLGQETLSGLPLRVKKGERKTLLDVKGSGSFRHLWTTHQRMRGATGSPYLLEFYIDGATRPNIQGDINDLVSAAARCEQPFVGVASSVAPDHSYNIYLPIPFEKSLRVELVATEPINAIFLQFDYRSGDESMKGIRLTQQGKGKQMRLVYSGIDDGRQPADTPTHGALRKERFEMVAGRRVVIHGPGVIRRLATGTTPAGARLRIRFDGEPTAAVDVEMADFFGPFQGVVLHDNQCYFPMPMKKQAEIEIVGIPDGEPVLLEVDLEPVDRFEDNWAYFHAKSHREFSSKGWFPYPVLCTGGRGHWVGMSLYDAGHNHGGGDFAIIDGQSARPLLLHGINGEDYFGFAWHANGKNLPYSEAVDWNKGRVRFHLENPYVFRHSLEIGWAVLRTATPHSVAYWYQDSAKDLSEIGKPSQQLLWQVFGPVSVPKTSDGNTPDVSDAERLFAGLPDPGTLDAGKSVTAEYFVGGRHKGLFEGWARQHSVGPHLNLTYIYRHVINRGGNGYLGSEPRAMMAATRLVSSKPQAVTLQVSYDDPLEIWSNGQLVHTDMELHQRLVTRNVKVSLKQGENRLLVKLVDTPNANYCWAGIILSILNAEGREISASLQDH